MLKKLATYVYTHLHGSTNVFKQAVLGIIPRTLCFNVCMCMNTLAGYYEPYGAAINKYGGH